MGPGQQVLERDTETAALLAAVADVTAGRGSVLLVDGPAGAGKTTLLTACAAAAVGRGCRVLTVAGADVESAYAFGLVRRLLAPAVRGAGAAALQGLPASTATLLASGPVEADDDAVHDPLPTLLHGLHDLVSSLAQDAPLVLVVDDVQWADEPSLTALDYLARRVAVEPVLLVLGARRPEVGTEQAEAFLTRLVVQGAARRFPLAPLTAAGVARLIAVRLGEPAAAEFVRACLAASGGNPFLLDAILDELADAGLTPDAAAAATVTTLAPGAVTDQVVVRVGRLGEAARSVAVAVAVLGDGTLVRDAADLAGLSVPDAEAAADLLADAGVLAPTRPLGFVHPLLRQAVYAELRPGRAAVLHRRAADVLLGVGAPAAQVAAHLLRTGPAGDASVVVLLRTAARAALAGGATSSAVQCLTRALAEPPPPAHRGEVLLELGLAQARAAEPGCTATLDAALAAGIDASRGAEVALELGRARWYLLGDAAGALTVLDGIDVEGLDPDTALHVEAQRVELRIGWVDGLGGLGPGAREVGLAALPALRAYAYPPRRASAVLLGSLARTTLELGGPADEAAALALDAARGGDEAVLYGSSVDVLAWTDRWVEGRALADDVVERGRRRGSPYMFGVGSLWRGVLRYRQGDVADAEADCRACVDVMQELGVEGIVFPLAFLVDAVLERDVDEAAALLGRVPEGVEPGPGEFLRHTRARLLLEQGRYADALAELEAGRPWHRSPAILPWWSAQALVLSRLGDTAAAARLAGEELELARAQGAGRAVGVALRTLGTVVGGTDGMGHLDEAVQVLGASGARLEQARALLELGVLLRVVRRPADAREPLRRALDLAERSRAPRLGQRVRDELLAAGGRPRRTAVTGVEALTGTELRVARLAADGLSNRQVAQELFVSTWTVAGHLTRVYEKLGVPGRDGLREVLARDVAMTSGG